MKPRKILAADETAQLIDLAVREHALAVLNVSLGDTWVTYKSRFLERDPARGFVVLDFQPTHGNVPPDAVQPGQYVGISFRHKSRKIMFASVLEARGKYMLNGGEAMPAARYRWPESLIELQRRAYYRTPVPGGVVLQVGLWRGGIGARSEAQRTPNGILSGEAVDLSCGGVLVRAAADTLPPAWTDNQTLGIELHIPDGRPPLMMNGYYRGVRQDDGGLHVATQFVGLEISPDGRSVLHRLARCVQRFHRIMFTGERAGSGHFELG